MISGILLDVLHEQFNVLRKERKALPETISTILTTILAIIRKLVIQHAVLRMYQQHLYIVSTFNLVLVMKNQEESLPGLENRPRQPVDDIIESASARTIRQGMYQRGTYSVSTLIYQQHLQVRFKRASI